MTNSMSVEKWQSKSRWVASGEVLTRIAEIEAKLVATRDYRERQRYAKALAFCCTSVAVLNAEFSPENLARIIAAGLKAKRCGGATELLGRTLLHLVRRRLDLLGVGEPVIVAEKKNRVTWDGGYVAVAASAAVVRNTMLHSEPEIVRSMNAGAFYMVGLGSDGSAPLTLQIVEFTEPMLPTREITKTDAVSDIGWLDVQDGMLLAGAAEALEKGAQLSVASGRYAVRLFRIGSRLTFVACRTNAPFDELREIPSI